MVEVDIKLTGDLSGLDKLEERIKQQVLRAGAAAMGKVIYDEVRSNAHRNRKSGKLLDAIYRVYSPEKSDDDSKMYRVSWNKKKAPHGHLLEFGTSRMAARPFLRPALSRVKEAIEVGKTRMADKLRSLR